MRLEWQILLAVLLDLALGDPRWLPHPVRAIGCVAAHLEGPTRRWIPWPRVAGVVAALLVYAITGGAAWGLIQLAVLLHPLAGDIVGILFIYTAIAARDMVSHSLAVVRPLSRGDLPQARQKLSMIVGRDVDRLDEAGIARAAIESVAESTVDGVTAPLFFAFLFGPVGAIVYRAVNTLDSMFGHMDQRYRHFGWASARLDDLANLLPARLTALVMAAAAPLVGQRGLAAARITWRDGRKHVSPNAGFPEAAMAGALGLQLGGVSYYDGQPIDKPAIGDPVSSPAVDHIRAANAVLGSTVVLFVLAGIIARLALLQAIAHWRAVA